MQVTFKQSHNLQDVVFRILTNGTVVVFLRVEQSEFMEFSEVSIFVNKEVTIKRKWNPC